MSFVFYDTETTGTDRVFDQILQFAAVRTDEELQELERFSIRCRLLPHVVPSPGAMQVTGVNVAQLLDPTLPSHYEMVRAIRAKVLAWSPALFIGYNSISFDEHLLRQAFYQTLHPPYLTNTGGNCRADALRMVRATALLLPGAITIPADDQGTLSFKLGRVASANGFDHANPHDALGDVEATMHLCRLLMERAPDLWSGFIRFTQKAAVIDYVANESVFCLSDFYGGIPYSWIVTPVGPSAARKSDIVVFDLAVDPDEIIRLSREGLSEQIARPSRIVRRLRTNACPIIVPAELAPVIASATQLERSELEGRAKLIRENDDLRQQLIGLMDEMIEERDPWPHVEQQLYDSFTSDGDLKKTERFHEVPWENRLVLLDDLEDARLKQLGRRLLFLERPDALPERIRSRMTLSLARRVIDGDGSGSWLCLQEAIQQLDELIPAANEQERGFLEEHRTYLSRRLAEMAALLV